MPHPLWGEEDASWPRASTCALWLLEVALFVACVYMIVSCGNAYGP